LLGSGVESTHQSSSLLALNIAHVRRPIGFIVQAVNGNECMVRAHVLLHIPDSTILDAGDGQDGMGTEDVETGSLLGIPVLQVCFGGPVEGIRRHLLERTQVPMRVCHGPVAHSAPGERAYSHGGDKQGSAAGVLGTRDAADEGWLVKEREDGVDDLKVDLDEIHDGSLTGNIRCPPWPPTG
jgi:hypothetical protein